MTIESYLLMAGACGAGATLAVAGLVMFYALGYAICKGKMERAKKEKGNE
jgi:hypothetical protein